MVGVSSRSVAVGVAVVVCLAVLWCGCGREASRPWLHHRPRPHPLLELVLASANRTDPPSHKKLICYYSLPRPGQPLPPPLPPANIDPKLCTHIIISSATLHNTTLVPRHPNDLQMYQSVVSLRQHNPSLQVLLRAEGDWPTLARDPLAVAVFAYNAGQFLRASGLGGLEVAWQYPAWPPWREGEAAHFSTLLLQLNNALKLASHPPLLLTAVVAATQRVIDRAYDIKLITKCVDFVSVETYDLHTFHPYLPFTGHGSPLRPSQKARGYWASLTTQWAAHYLLGKGLPREKLVVMLPTYAVTWKLLSSNWTGVGAPAVGVGMLGGRLTHSQVCTFLQEGAKQHWDDDCRVPYAWRSRDWVSYEDEDSVKEKVEWVVAEGLAGVGVLDLNTDDWAGLCSSVTFQLATAARKVLCRTRDSPAVED